MRTKIKAARARWRAFMDRRTRVGRLSVRLLLIIFIALFLRTARLLPGLDLFVAIVCLIILSPLLLLLAYRWIAQRVLWKVRNRLIVTYLLMGLAPIVLFSALGGIASYALAGQFATNMALSALDEASANVRDESASDALAALNNTPANPLASQPGHISPKQPEHPATAPTSQLTVFIQHGSTWQPLLAPGTKPGTAALPPPDPKATTPQLPFRGVVSYQEHLYLCSETTVRTANRPLLVVGSIPLDSPKLTDLARSLGIITIGSFSRTTRQPRNTSPNADQDAANDADTDTDSDTPPPPPPPTSARPHATPADDNPSPADHGFARVKGGKLPPPAHFWDIPIGFSTPLTVTSWETGDSASDVISVVSRPTLLYAKLFQNSFTAGRVVSIVLWSIAGFFALLQAFALLMAMLLSRTITRSVADIYRGTREIDAGHLDHRIPVTRRDQLGALAGSFNGMAASISDLLIQQREKERLLNELMIAQEVQTTLFPDSPASLGGFEMHAMSLPARTVGGDYFDFIFGPGNNLCLALGDISGKGISAALLMASLNSAVRAFILGHETDHDATGSSTPSPALLLTLLNRHLYISTQSARYATLFLAAYDVETRTLTYSNGGHLPPVILSTDGTIRRLDAGGSVVGLLEDLEYVEATVQLEPGDLLIAFTDGLTEPENDATIEFGEDRLLHLMSQHRQLPLPLLASTTLKTLQDWIGTGEQPDDMTILLARQL